MSDDPGGELRPGVRRVVRPPGRGREKVREETEEEIRVHIELRTDELVRRGWTPEAAREEAVRRFGGTDRARRTLVRAAHGRERRMRMRGWAEAMVRDVRLALRGLAGRPGFTTAAVVTLALGVGANAALFGVVRNTLLDPLPFPEPERLVRVLERTGPGDQLGNVSVPNLEDLRSGNRTLEQVGRFQLARVRARFGEETALLPATLVEAEVFHLLGRAPLLGRLPEAGEDDVVVVSHGLWRSRLGGDPAALGRTLDLEGEPYPVVGVMPPDFAVTGSEASLWAILPPPAEYMRNRRVHVSGAVARVRPGVSQDEVRQDMEAVSRAIQDEHAGEDPGHTLEARPLRATFTRSARTPLLVLGGAVVLVLLIACANIAGLQLARAASREEEMGVRLALGAGRPALVRQLVVENVLLFTLGAAVSVPVAFGGVRWLLAHAPGGLPRAAEIAVDAPVLLAAFAVTAGLGVLFGLVPALHAARTDVADALGERSGGDRRSASRTRSALVVAQLAVSVALLAGVGLLVRSLWALQTVDPGFRAENLVVLRVSVPEGYDAGRVPEFYRRVPEVLGRVPGVQAVSATSALPVSGGEGRGEVAVEGRPFDPGDAPSASFRRVLPGHFEVMGIPVREGRAFTDRDVGEGEWVVVINETMARRLFPDGDALGRRIKVGPAESEPWLTVVGVVGDVRNQSLEAVDAFATYEPHAQRPRTSMYVVARAGGSRVAELVPPLRRALLELEPRLYVYETGTMEARISASTATRRFNALFLGAFALTALALAAAGVYGLTAQTVAQREREMGIRIALGASPQEVLRLLVGRSGRLAAAGLVLGLAGAAWLVRLLQGLLYGVEPFDPVTLVGVTVLLGGATLVAAWLPARRARAVDPASALSAR